MDKKKLRGILLVFLSTAFAAVGQLFWKFSSESFSLTIQGTILNYNLLLGFLGHFLQLVLLVLAYRDLKLTTAYPLVSLGFVWVFLLSIIFLKESVLFINWLGVFSIMAGITFITRCEA